MMCRFALMVFLAATALAARANKVGIPASISASSHTRDAVSGATSCPSLGGFFHSISITDCSAQPCILLIGETYQVDITFECIEAHKGGMEATGYVVYKDSDGKEALLPVASATSPVGCAQGTRTTATGFLKVTDQLPPGRYTLQTDVKPVDAMTTVSCCRFEGEIKAP